MYLDADVLYAYLKPTDWLKNYALKVIKHPNLITSSITILELEIISKRDFDLEFSTNVLSKVKLLSNLKIVEFNEQIQEKAVELRKKHQINIFDSIHAATTILKNEIIISSDLAFDSIKELKRKDPRTFI